MDLPLVLRGVSSFPQLLAAGPAKLGSHVPQGSCAQPSTCHFDRFNLVRFNRLVNAETLLGMNDIEWSAALALGAVWPGGDESHVPPS